MGIYVMMDAETGHTDQARKAPSVLQLVVNGQFLNGEELRVPW